MNEAAGWIKKLYISSHLCLKLIDPPKHFNYFFRVLPFKRQEANRVTYLLCYQFDSVAITAGVVKHLIT